MNGTLQLASMFQALVRFPASDPAHLVRRYYPYDVMAQEQLALVQSTMKQVGIADKVRFHLIDWSPLCRSSPSHFLLRIFSLTFE